MLQGQSFLFQWPASAAGALPSSVPRVRGQPVDSSLALVARASGHRVADLSGASQGLGEGRQQGWHGLLSPNRPYRQSKVLPVPVSLGVALGCRVPPASGGYLAAVCPSSQFNEPREDLHGLSICPRSVCQSSPALAPTLPGKRPSLLGVCPCLPSCLLPAEASRQGLTCPRAADVPSLASPSPLRAAWDGFLLGMWETRGEMRVPDQTALKGLPAPSLPADHSGSAGRDVSGLACPQVWQLPSPTLPAGAVGFGGLCPAHPRAEQ